MLCVEGLERPVVHPEEGGKKERKALDEDTLGVGATAKGSCEVELGAQDMTEALKVGKAASLGESIKSVIADQCLGNRDALLGNCLRRRCNGRRWVRPQILRTKIKGVGLEGGAEGLWRLAEVEAR